MKIKTRTVTWTLMLLVVGVLGWQWYQRHFPSWDEEVQLSDGRMIIVHRAHTFNTENVLIETALTFDLPEMGGKQTWREFLYPAIVDVYQGKVYVVGAPLSSAQYAAYRSPRNFYVAFIFVSNKWTRIPFIEVPEILRRAQNIPPCATSSTYADWQSKQSVWCNQGQMKQGASRLIDMENVRRHVEYLNRRDNSTNFSE